MDAKTLFEKSLPELLQKNPEKAREVNAVYFFNITGDTGGQWTVDLKSDSPAVKPGDTGNADCSIEMTAEDFVAGIKDQQMMMQFFFQGKLKVTGDPMLATKLQAIFANA